MTCDWSAPILGAVRSHVACRLFEACRQVANRRQDAGGSRAWHSMRKASSPEDYGDPERKGHNRRQDACKPPAGCGRSGHLY